MNTPVHPPVRRWEHGSEFHFLAPGEGVSDPQHPWDRGHLFLAGGRNVLTHLIDHGRAVRGWRRMLVPDYYCPEVVRAIVATGIPLGFYPADPRQPIEWPVERLQDGDAVLVVNTFGCQFAPVRPVRPGLRIELVEDHSHDPWSGWSWSSTADFALASLRKVLPIPDGGVLWSPAGHSLPAQPGLAPGHASAAASRLAAMVLKDLYLQGWSIPKEEFRNLQMAAETALAETAVSAALAFSRTFVQRFPAQQWRLARRRNFDCLQGALAAWRGGRLLLAPAADQVPYGVILLLDSPGRRNALRTALIGEGIYPAILWSHGEQDPDPSREYRLSEHLLFLHCDGRYTESDMLQVGRCLLRHAGPDR